MKTGRYSFRELLLHQEIEQIIIPEVQRDYVWQTANVERLMDNILQFFNERSSLRLEISINGIVNSEAHLVSHLQKELERLQYHLKIGFIYAYHDPSYPGKFFLIDGQQRFTTLYLLLLSLYRRTSRQDDFRYNYFPGDQLKIDYKVRRAAHDFMRDFVRHELSDESHDFTKSKFYYRHYENDVTINNLLTNYRFITNYISGKIGPGLNLTDLSSFLEDFVELNFFDTQLSAQGEQLYLYMNARGEQLSFQEEIKSTVIGRVATDDKRQAGKYWEDWQNFFWRHRKYENEQEQKVSRENADAGFQEFLKWATIIQVATSDDEQLMQYLSSQSGNARRPYRELKNSLVTRSRRGESEQLRVLENYQLARQEFSFDYLAQLADAIMEIYDDHLATAGDFMKGAYLTNDFQASSYLIICPLIYYYSHIRLKESVDQMAAMKSLGMWLKNLTYFSSTVGRRPDDSTIYLLEIMKLMIDANENDIASLLTLVKPGQYSEILPASERSRLDLLRRHGASGAGFEGRDELESIMWDVTNDKKTNAFLEGNMSILFDCVAYDFSVSFDELLLGNEELKALRDYWMILKDLIVPEAAGNISDTMRRAMLTFGDYSIQESGSWAFGNYIYKYSFLSNQAEWRSFFKSDKPKQFFLKMMKDIRYSLISYSRAEFIKYLSGRISAFADKEEWRYPFIKYAMLMRYMQDKKFLYENEDHIVLLSKTIMSATYCEQSLLIFIAAVKMTGSYIQQDSVVLIDLLENKKLNYKLVCRIIHQKENNNWIWLLVDDKNVPEAAREILIQNGWTSEHDYFFPPEMELAKTNPQDSVTENTEMAAGNFLEQLRQMLESLSERQISLR